MFKTNKLYSKYRIYLKWSQMLKNDALIKRLKAANVPQSIPKLNFKRFSNVIDSLNKSEHIEKIRKTLSNVQNNLEGINIKESASKPYRNAVSVMQNSVLQEKNKKCHKKPKETSTSEPTQHIPLLNLIRQSRINRHHFAVAGATIAATEIDQSVTPPIPEPPPIPEVLSEEVVQQLNSLGEPTFASLGLGGWTPVGMVQNCFEYLHVSLGVPWWAAIVIGTIFIRTLMLPLVVIAQRNAAKMNNNLPQMQALQQKMTEARLAGNQLDAARYSQELMVFMNEKGLNPLKNMIVPLAQMPVFISFFVGLRQMATVPVESLRTGGLFWFKDLTVPDQFFAMPIITSITLWATIELGTDAAKLSTQNMQIMKYVFRAIPLIILPFTVNFPGAILCYWVSSNFISLLQVGILRMPKVRDYFRIDPHIKHNPADLPVKSKGFKEGIRESWTNVKLTKELEERRRLDELQFQRAGKGPLVKTYKYDPTKQITNPNAMNAKKR